MRISGWVVGAGLGMVMSCSSPSTSGLKSTGSGGGADGGLLPADGAAGGATSGATDGAAGSVATTSTCVNSLDCSAGMVCDKARSLCVACVTAADCSSGQVCANDVCRDTCVSDKDCTSAGLLCDRAAGHCVQCLTDGDCRSGGVCASGQCTTLGGTGGSTGAGGSSSGGNGGNGGTTSAGGTSGSGGGIGSGGAGGVCVNGISPATRPPLDIVVLLDTSGSMNENVTGGTKWAVISGALTAFLNAPANAGLGVGLGYFPAKVPGAPATCTTDADCKTAAGDFGTCTGTVIPTLGCLGCTCSLGDGCVAATYQTPEVPLALPPDHTPAVTSIQGHSPGGGTPTRPALEGTLTYATSWAAKNPGRKVAVVFATDGDPTGCTTNTVTDVANLAASALAGASQIETYVIGVGASLTSMNQVAAAGGTGQAYVIDTATDPGAAFQDAMNDIRARATPCNFLVPAGADLTRVNVRITPGGSSTPTTVPHITGACGAAGGWYYDATGGRSISVCPTTCADVGTTGKVELQLVCTGP